MNMELNTQTLTEDLMKSNIIEIVKTHLNSYSYILQHGKKYVHYYNYIMEKTKDFKDLPFATRIYWVLNDITSYPKCENPNCSNELRHDLRCNPIDGYVSRACSPKCGLHTEHRILAFKHTCLEKYGVEHPSLSQQFHDKFYATISKRSALEKDAINAKRKNTCNEKYGVDSISKLDEVKAQKTLTFANRTDEQRRLTLQKTLQTKLERYGNSNFVNALKQSLTRSLFSTEQIEASNEIRRLTTLEKYGVENVSLTEHVRKAVSAKKQRSECMKFFNNCIIDNEYVEPLFDLDHYIAHSHDELKWRCKKCGKEFVSKKFYHYINSRVPARCLDCYPLSQPTSLGEHEIVEFIKTFYNGEIVENTRLVISPLELDIYIPLKKIAIEYDGVYWHSENMGTSSDYHLNKTQLCENQGIHLLHIFDVEWHALKELVKSRIRNCIIGSENKVFARKCSICALSRSEANGFIIENHMQGSCNFKTAIGLNLNGELVSVMAFGKPRFNKEYDCELLRFCNKLGTLVVGGASKLLKYYEREFLPKSIVSYADRRWSNGDLYLRIGFLKLGLTKPNYWYWNYGKGSSFLENRVRYLKHRLSKLLDSFDQNKTEVENMYDNGYFRIFDCGNLVFVKLCR